MKGGCAKDIQSSLLCSKDEFTYKCKNILL